jgi:ubiquinone/menaquinone biosynthesis C-methylase UbiE
LKEDIRYDNHDLEWKKCISDERKSLKAKTWIKKDNTLDTWRHHRMYKLLEPIVDYEQSLKWLTVGDGRYGADANALINMGAKNVFCTDISDTLLKIGNENGFIQRYAAENAEQLSFNESEFDFILCKESYHHFPRPHIALHEMLRVCSKGVILIEPNDAKIDQKILNYIWTVFKKILGRDMNISGHDFEPVGNYVFSISQREMEKFQLGMHRRFIAYKNFNDYYESGFEFINLDKPTKLDRLKILKAKSLIGFRNFLSRYALIAPGLLASVLFKCKPDKELIDKLKKNGWKIKELPQNPFL